MSAEKKTRTTPDLGNLGSLLSRAAGKAPVESMAGPSGDDAASIAQEQARKSVQDDGPKPVQSRVQRRTQTTAQKHAQEIAQLPAQVRVQKGARGAVAIPRKIPMKRLHCYVPEEQMDLIDQLADGQGVDKADIVRHMIEFYRANGPLTPRLR